MNRDVLAFRFRKLGGEMYTVMGANRVSGFRGAAPALRRAECGGRKGVYLFHCRSSLRQSAQCLTTAQPYCRIQ